VLSFVAETAANDLSFGDSRGGSIAPPIIIARRPAGPLSNEAPTA
jgi:hypothetical protein